MEDFNYMIIIGIFYILICLLLFLINITLCFIHIREPILRTNFFNVVFVQLILEALISFFLLILILTILISRENETWHLVYDIPLNFLINTDVIYNIVILIYLIFKSRTKKSEEDTEKIDLRNSISFSDKFSYKFIHIPSIFLGLIHTIIFIPLREKNITIESWGDWFYFFYPIKACTSTLFLFIPFMILFIISIPYKFLSINFLGVTNYIKLNHYSINCMMMGILGIIMPIMKVISMKIKNSAFPVLLFSSAFFLLYLICLCLYRINCMYIDNILTSNGKELKSQIKLFFNLMLFRVEVPKLNFIDFNNNFIYHSLAHESDFLTTGSTDARISLSSQN